LNQPLEAIPDGIVDYIYSRHTFEHINNLTGLMEEIHRILSSRGKVDVVVPHFSNVYGHSDPTHVRVFGIGSMYYFCSQEQQPKRKVPSFYSKARFQVSSINLRFYREDWLDNLVAPWLEKLVNRSYRTQVFYERHFAYIFPAWEISFQLKKDVRS
jgi:ubiquinone/menaquinone biosynthesis C-methylase UbiE